MQFVTSVECKFGYIKIQELGKCDKCKFGRIKFNVMKLYLMNN